MTTTCVTSFKFLLDNTVPDVSCSNITRHNKPPLFQTFSLSFLLLPLWNQTLASILPGPCLIKKNLPGHGLTKVENHWHRASVKRFVSLQFLNPKPVSRTSWTGNQSVARLLPTQDNTNTE
jgi:hypothetical protein